MVRRRLLLALPFVLITRFAAAQAHAPIVTISVTMPDGPCWEHLQSEDVGSLAGNRRRSPSLHQAGGTRTDASAAFAAVVASSLRRAISSTIAVV
jgi:hypothetical protein